MASVSRCDCCGKIGNHKDYHFIKIFEENEIGHISNLEYTKELCPECTEKVVEVLKKDDSK